MHELMNTTKEVFGKIEKNGEQGQAAKNQAQENLKYDFWLASLLYIDSRKRIRVREMCGSAQAVYELKEETLKNMYLFTDTELQYLLESRKKDLNRIWECFLAKNMQLIPYSSRAYPDKLTHIAQPPYAIFCKGAMPDARKSVGIVGARMCSEYGRSIATKLGKLLADKDVQVISGMALGIDSASHAGALQGKGSTFAVLGCGCDVCYPKNARNLYENIQSSGGGILSEYAPLTGLPEQKSKRILTTGGHYAYLKIAEGCDKHCTYCVIPSLRGPYRSVPMEQLLAEAKDLVDQGVQELILVAQETTIYGMDLYGEKSLHKLLKELCKLEDLVWIRVLYCYPEEIYPELIETMKSEQKICHYLDLPIQHASDTILKRMGRRMTKAGLVGLIQKLREEMPDIVLRTTLITGFPGETEEDHNEVLDFVDEMEFDRLGVFTYSREDGTPAASMPDQIDEEVKAARRDRIMELQQDISLDKGENRVGTVMDVVIEGKVADEDAYIARSYADAPGVDGYVFIQNVTADLMSGTFVKVYIKAAMEYDLIGELYDEDDESAE